MGADIPLFEILIVNNDESNDMMRIIARFDVNDLMVPERFEKTGSIHGREQKMLQAAADGSSTLA